MKKSVVFIIILVLMFSILSALVEDTDVAQINNLQNQSVISMNLSGNSGSGVIYRYGSSKGLLYSQVGDTISSYGYFCIYDSIRPCDANVADDITPTGAGWDIDSVGSWWVYGTWDSIPNIHFKVYADSGGQPEQLPYIDLVVEKANYTAINHTTIRAYVIMELPSTLSLLNGSTYWISVVPSMATGYMLGWQGNVLGGAEAWYKSDYYSYPQWVTMNSIHGQPIEVFFELYGSEINAIEETPVVIPADFKVTLLAPTIFSNNTTIQYTLPVSRKVSFRVFDLTGREVRNNNYGMVLAGIHTLSWNCVDNNNSQVSAGTYFFRLEAGDNIATGKLIIAR